MKTLELTDIQKREFDKLVEYAHESPINVFNRMLLRYEIATRLRSTVLTSKQLAEEEMFMLRGSTHLMWDPENPCSLYNIPDSYTQQVELERTVENYVLGKICGLEKNGIPRNPYYLILLENLTNDGKFPQKVRDYSRKLLEKYRGIPDENS